MKAIRLFLLGMIAAGTLVAFQNCGKAPESTDGTESSSSLSTYFDIFKPTIISAPQSLTANLFENLDVDVVVQGNNIQYQWYKDGVAISGQSGHKLNIPSTNFSDSGLYTLKAMNQYGSTSADVQLEVVRGADQNPPTIATAPANTFFTYSVFSGVPIFNVLNQGAAQSSTATFSVLATGEDLTYQWYKLDAQGTPALISGARGQSYTFLVNNLNLIGTYRVVVTNQFGSVMAQATLSRL